MLLTAPEEIRKGLTILFKGDTVVELRVLGTTRGLVSGYFDKLDALAASVIEWGGRCGGVYVTLNPVDPACLARAMNRTVEYAKRATRDHEIVCRRWFLV